MKEVKIGKHIVGGDNPCFVIAEIGINHNGNLKVALQLIDVAVAAGCSAVKFQKRTVEVVYSQEELAKPRQVDRSILESAIERGVLSDEAVQRLRSSDFTDSTNGDLKFALEFTKSEYAQINEYCKERGILWGVSPWDEHALDEISAFDQPFIKIASATLTDDELLKKVRSYKKPIVLSTGMSTMEEVRHAVEVLGESDLVLLHTVSTYPAKESELNLRVMHTLRSMFPGIPIGYSGHENGTTLSVCAAALGACVIERHITLDRTMPGSDQAASLEPDGLKRVVSNIRRLEQALGSSMKELLDCEKPIKAKLRRK